MVLCPTFRLGITLDRWGPGAWNTLHSFAHTSPKELTVEQQEQWRTFLHTFATLLPCPTCRKHFAEYLLQQEGPDTFSTRETLVRFLHDAHNEVNRRTGKRVWSLEEHQRVYSRRGADCLSGADLAARGTAIVVLVLVACLIRAHRKKITPRPLNTASTANTET